MGIKCSHCGSLNTKAARFGDLDKMDFSAHGLGFISQATIAILVQKIIALVDQFKMHNSMVVVCRDCGEISHLEK